VFLTAYNILENKGITSFVFLLLLPLFLIDLRLIRKLKNTAELDPFLRKLALKTLLLTLVYGIGFIY
jgi:1,4-dihydroxy-2-naphthoate octaprenyltransferase